MKELVCAVCESEDKPAEVLVNKYNMCVDCKRNVVGFIDEMEIRAEFAAFRVGTVNFDPDKLEVTDCEDDGETTFDGEFHNFYCTDCGEVSKDWTPCDEWTEWVVNHAIVHVKDGWKCDKED